MINNVGYWLEETAKKYPNKIGFCDIECQVTFSEFYLSAKKVASSIPENICKAPIAVMMEKCVNQLIVFLGIAYSGNFYIPIDPKMPEERIQIILKLLEAKLVITDANSYEKVNRIAEANHMEIMTYEKCCRGVVEEKNIQERFNQTISVDPLYVLFTSGSTGIPKGVIITHGSVCDYVDWVIDTFRFDEKTVFANQAPFYFDNSILDIYTTLKVGATMYIVPEEYFIFPSRLIDYLNLKQVNSIFWVPSAISAVANMDGMKDKKPEYLEKVLFCGEVMPNKQLNYWRKKMPNVMYANLYGPTEITDVCTYYIVDREFRDDEPLPIGKACRNTEVIILNEKNMLCEIEEIGELCVRGICLSKGYFQNKEKTEMSFVQNPLNKKWEDLIYRTGDLVKLNKYGEIIYIGRKDFQIKHMGHRIELGEIESAVYTIQKIAQCCAIYDESAKKIILICALKTGDLTEQEIYKELQKKLPKYMMPSVIRIIKRMPLNANGKIDRVLIKEKLGELEP